jgi:hypothetical protein
VKTIEFLNCKGESIYIPASIYKGIHSKSKVIKEFITEDNKVRIEFKHKRGKGHGYTELTNVGLNGVILKEFKKKKKIGG